MKKVYAGISQRQRINRANVGFNDLCVAAFPGDVVAKCLCGVIVELDASEGMEARILNANIHAAAAAE